MAKTLKTPKKSDNNTRVVKKSVAPRAAKRTVQSEENVTVVSKKYTNMFAAYRAFWARGFTDWMGTSSRSEYWWTVLMNVLIVLIASLLMYGLVMHGISSMFDVFGGIIILGVLFLYGLAAIIPSISLILRRLHDGGFSSWWIVLYPIGLFAPYIGYVASLVLFVLMLMPTRVDGKPYHKYNQ